MSTYFGSQPIKDTGIHFNELADIADEGSIVRGRVSQSEISVPDLKNKCKEKRHNDFHDWFAPAAETKGIIYIINIY